MAGRTGLPGIVFYGNCQAEALKDAFARLAFIRERFSLYSILSFDASDFNPSKQMKNIDANSIVLVFEQLDGLVATPPWLTDGLSKRVTRLSFVPLDTNLLWPFHFNDPRNRPEPGHPFGRYPYGDRIVVKLLPLGLRGEAAYAAYTFEKRRQWPNLERLASLEADRLRNRETGSDIKIADVVINQMELYRLFWTYNHPSGFLLKRLACRMLEAAGALLKFSYTESLLDDVWRNYDPLRSVQVPIDPGVATDLKLKWWTSDETYTQIYGGVLNYKEYFLRYINFI